MPVRPIYVGQGVGNKPKTILPAHNILPAGIMFKALKRSLATIPATVLCVDMGGYQPWTLFARPNDSCRHAICRRGNWPG